MEPPKKKARAGGDAERDTDAVVAMEDDGDLEVSVEGVTLKVHGIILVLSSPVFAAFLRSGMREGLARRVDLPGKSKAEFEMFMEFLRPCSRQLVDDNNVDRMLPWFDEYQVTSWKVRCEEFLLKKPVSMQRLIQAHQYQLERQLSRCLDEFSLESFKNDFEEVASMPGALKRVLSSLERRFPATKLMCDLLRVALESKAPLGSLLPVLKVLVLHQTEATTLDAHVYDHFKRVVLNNSDTMNVMAELLEAILKMTGKVKDAARCVVSMFPIGNLSDRRRANDVVLGTLRAEADGIPDTRFVQFRVGS